MVKQINRYVWNAVATIELRDLCLSVQYDEVARGGRKVKEFKSTGWLQKNENEEQVIMLDAGKRLRGWFKQQAKTIKPSLYEALKYGLKCDSMPSFGMVPIAKLSDITSCDDFPEIKKEEYFFREDMKDIGYPFMECIQVPKEKGTGTRSAYTFHYIINKPIKFQVKIQSFARGFTPEAAKEMLEKLGDMMGLGDGYAQGYGCFRLIDFKVMEKMELNI